MRYIQAYCFLPALLLRVCLGVEGKRRAVGKGTSQYSVGEVLLLSGVRTSGCPKPLAIDVELPGQDPEFIQFCYRLLQLRRGYFVFDLG